MGWLAILSLVFTYGPALIDAVRSLIEAVQQKNQAKGADAVEKTAALAAAIVRSFQTRSDMTTDQKREQAWKDLIAGMANMGVVLSETNARTFTQLAYQHESGK